MIGPWRGYTRQQEWQQKMREERRCPHCGRPAPEGYITCENVRARERARYYARGKAHANG